MGLSKTIWTNPSEYLVRNTPDDPVMFFSPAVLQATARRFIDGFPGLVTYAVKSNPDRIVIENLAAAGIRGFDVASPEEIRLIRRLVPDAALHYNNPVRSRAEIAMAVEMEVKSYSVDSHSELAKLAELVPAEGTEISVRFKLPVQGAAYNFGAKFGATVELATELLRAAAGHGFTPSLTFHPGTQCTDPAAWETYILTAAEIARDAGVTIARLNVGGGFPSHRLNEVMPRIEATFAMIDLAAAEAFGENRPALVCEPGRGLRARSPGQGDPRRWACVPERRYLWRAGRAADDRGDRPDRGALAAGRAAQRRGRGPDLLRPDLRFGRPAAGGGQLSGRYAGGRLRALPRPRRLFDGDQYPVQRLW
jgi:ornithine decarboxylase